MGVSWRHDIKSLKQGKSVRDFPAIIFTFVSFAGDSENKDFSAKVSGLVFVCVFSYKIERVYFGCLLMTLDTDGQDGKRWFG